MNERVGIARTFFVWQGRKNAGIAGRFKFFLTKQAEKDVVWRAL